MDPLLTSFGLEKTTNVADRFQFFLGKPLVFINYLITVVWFRAALGEELFVRGHLLNMLTKLFDNSRWTFMIALIILSIIFGMLHIYQGWYGVITTGVISIVFGGVYAFKKNIPCYISAYIYQYHHTYCLLFIKWASINNVL